jgi:hypothetical protein
MKTVINEHGCTTHPYGEPSLDVTVPFTVNGQNVTEQLTQLTVANLKLRLKVEELQNSLETLQKLLKTTEEALETRFASLSVAATVKTEEQTAAAAKNGKKPAVKTTSDSSTESATTTT